MQISKVQTADLEVLRSFAERTFRIAFQHLNDPGRFEKYCEKSFSQQQFLLELQQTSSGFWIVWKDNTLVAYIKLNFDQHPVELKSSRTVQVERLYVDPSFQGQKIGEKLLDFAYQQALQAKAEWLWLSVWQAIPASLRFYQRCGYEIFGTETFWLADEAQIDWLVKLKVVS